MVAFSIGPAAVGPVLPPLNLINLHQFGQLSRACKTKTCSEQCQVSKCSMTVPIPLHFHLFSTQMSTVHHMPGLVCVGPAHGSVVL